MPADHNPHDGKSFATLLTIICLVTFGSYFAVSMRLPVVPLYARSFGITTAQIGIINSAFYLMAGLLSLPSGYLSDIFGKKRMAVLGSAIFPVGLLLLYFSHTYPQLAGIYLFLGIGIAAFGPTMMSFVARISPPTHLGRAYGWYTTALFCGLSLGPAFGGAIGQWLGLRPVFLVATVLVVVNLWAVMTFIPSRKTLPDDSDAGESVSHGLRQLAANHPLLGCWLATFGACIVAGLFFTFFPLHASDRGLDVSQIGIVYLTQSMVNAVSRIPFGYLSDMVTHRKHLAITGLLLIAFAIAGFGLATGYAHFILATVCLGASMGLAFTSIGALIAETVTPRFRGLAMGGYNSCIYLGLMTGSIALGPVIEGIGFERSFFLTGAITLLFVITSYVLLKDFRRTG